MERQIKINFYKGLDTEALQLISSLNLVNSIELAIKLEKIKTDSRLVNLVLKERRK